MFYRSDLKPSGIEDLLDKVDAANAMQEIRSDSTGDNHYDFPDDLMKSNAFSSHPRIEEFLDEEGTFNAKGLLTHTHSLSRTKFSTELPFFQFLFTHPLPHASSLVSHSLLTRHRADRL